MTSGGTDERFKAAVTANSVRSLESLRNDALGPNVWRFILGFIRREKEESSSEVVDPNASVSDRENIVEKFQLPEPREGRPDLLKGCDAIVAVHRHVAPEVEA